MTTKHGMRLKPRTTELLFKVVIQSIGKSRFSSSHVVRPFRVVPPSHEAKASHYEVIIQSTQKSPFSSSHVVRPFRVVHEGMIGWDCFALNHNRESLTGAKGEPKLALRNELADYIKHPYMPGNSGEFQVNSYRLLNLGYVFPF